MVNLKGMLVGVVLGVGLGAFAGHYFTTPVSVYSRDDFDHNGVMDLVQELPTGIKEVLFGVSLDGGILYLPTRRMVRRNPNSITSYPTIENQINKN